MANDERKPLTVDDLKVRHVYRAKRPAQVGGYTGTYVNDRIVLYVTSQSVQYDGPSVGIGQRHPSVPTVKFLSWASHEVTDEIPDDDWLSWHKFLQQKRANGGTK